MDDRLFCDGFNHQEWLRPSRMIHIPVHEDVSGVECVSYSDKYFGVAGLGCTDRILAIELKRFGEAHPQAGKEIFPTTFLAVDTGDFLDPSDPPVAILLGYYRVRIGHSQSPYEAAYYISLLLSTHPVSRPATEGISESALRL